MKAFFLALLLTLTAKPALAEAVIPPKEAPQHIGQVATVEGVVAEIHRAQSGKAIFIDIGGRYPNNTFVAVIFKDDISKFSSVDSLAGKTIDVTGQIKEYQGRPEIILNDPSQIKIIK
jgi:DNA/RNA endonuclease YhcR with UshA esterase domain